MTNKANYIKQSNTIKRIIFAFYYSACGFKAAFKEEAAFRMEVFLSGFMIPAALFLGVNATEQAILIGSWFLVLIAEIINSAIEAVVDRISLEIHPGSKKSKDMGSAAVFLSIINLVAIWTIILINNFIAR